MVYISGGNELINRDKLFKHLDIKEGMKIGDLGCGGAGHFALPAARLVGSKGLVYGVDILKSALQSIDSRARLEGINNLKTIWSNLEIYGATKIHDETLDIALLINIFFQSKEHEEILKETKRMVKKEGQILVVDWNQTATPFGPPLIDRVKPQEIKKLAKELNLELIDEFEVGKYHYGLVFTKK